MYVASAGVMVSFACKAMLVVGLVVAALAAGLTYVRQNRASRMGGPISRGKALWLGYAIFLWFVACPALALEPRLSPPFRIVLGSFGLSMWLRGLAELYLLYVGRGWRPPYGMVHDAFCLVLVGVQAVWLRGPLAAAALYTPLGRWALALVIVVVVSLILEIGYAWTFHKLVRGRTTGVEGIWFASGEDPRFRNLVRVTALANVPLYGFLALFLGALLR